jgi:hypothetical protein
MVVQTDLMKKVKPLNFKGLVYLTGGADGVDLLSVGRALSSIGYPARKTKMLPGWKEIISASRSGLFFQTLDTKVS